MKKKTGLILAAVGAGAGFLAGRFIERIATVKSLVDRIEDVGGSDDLEDYLYDRYGKITEKMKTKMNSMTRMETLKKMMTTLTMRKTKMMKIKLRQ